MSDTTLPALQADPLALPDTTRLEPSARVQHLLRILLLYGSLRNRSYSWLLVEEADRLLRAIGPRLAVSILGNCLDAGEAGIFAVIGRDVQIARRTFDLAV